MKKVLMLLFAIAIFGCGSDDSGADSAQIIGRWTNVGKTINGGAMAAHENNCDTSSDFWDILPDSTILFNHYGFTCELGNSFTGNWDLSANTLSVWSTFDPVAMDEDFTVVHLSETELELEHTIETPEGDAIERLYFQRE